jgi:effector-binding domain-containing protein
VSYEVMVESVESQLLAAVRRTVRVGDVGRAWKPALDQVWTFLRATPEMRRGHNVFLYHHPQRRGDPMAVDFGVQVFEAFEPAGDVLCVETPSGIVARTVHRGPYDQLGAAHEAIQAWCTAHDRTIGSASWETYGDTTDDPVQLETTISYLLA